MRKEKARISGKLEAKLRNYGTIMMKVRNRVGNGIMVGNGMMNMVPS